MSKITPCLWFDNQAEEAVNFYLSIFSDGKILNVARYAKGTPGVEGSIMTIDFHIDGQQFTALNGGPHFKFNEAISLMVNCATQAEIDYYWSKLTEGGEEVQCGWLKDTFGVSWQIVPKILPELISGPDSARAQRVMAAVLQMKKLELATLLQAAESA